MQTAVLIYLFISGVVGWAAAIVEWRDRENVPAPIRLTCAIFLGVFMFFAWPLSLFAWVSHCVTR